LAPQSAVQKHQLHFERGKVMSEGAPCRQPRPGTYLVCRPTEEHHTQRVGLLLPAHSRRRFSHWIHHLPLHVAPAHATVFAPSDPVSTKTPLPIVHGQQRGGVRGARVETTEVWRQQCKGHCTAMPIPHRQPFERREMDHVEGIRGAPQHTTRQSGDQPTIRLCKRRPSTAGDGGLPRWLPASPQVAVGRLQGRAVCGWANTQERTVVRVRC